MTQVKSHHAAPMGLKTVLFGLVYYKHVAPTELAAWPNYIINVEMIPPKPLMVEKHGIGRRTSTGSFSASLAEATVRA